MKFVLILVVPEDGVEERTIENPNELVEAQWIDHRYFLKKFIAFKTMNFTSVEIPSCPSWLMANQMSHRKVVQNATSSQNGSTSDARDPWS